MNAPDRNDSDEGEGGQRLSSELWPCLHSVHAAAGGEDAMDASPYSIRARSRRQGQPQHPRAQAPAGPAAASGRKGPRSRTSGLERWRRAALARIQGKATEGARER